MLEHLEIPIITESKDNLGVGRFTDPSTKTEGEDTLVVGTFTDPGTVDAWRILWIFEHL